MPTGRTAYQMFKDYLLGKKELAVEEQFYNPLGCKIGCHARFSNTVAMIRGEYSDLQNDLFVLKEIWSWKRVFNHQKETTPMCDYVFETENKRIVVRVDEANNFLLMTQHWPETDDVYTWGEDSPFVLEGCTSEDGKLMRFNGTPEEETYWRDLNGAKCDVSVIRDKNRDGKVQMNEVEERIYTLWTFRRHTEIHGQTLEQHLDVQLSGWYKGVNCIDGGDKTLVMLRGEQVFPANIMIY